MTCLNKLTSVTTVLISFYNFFQLKHDPVLSTCSSNYG